MIFRIMYGLAIMALREGFSLKRWRQLVNAMMHKEQGPTIRKDASDASVCGGFQLGNQDATIWKAGNRKGCERMKKSQGLAVVVADF